MYVCISIYIYIYVNVRVIEVTGEDISEVFEQFCHADYVNVIDKECENVIAENNVPSPYPVEAFASENEKTERLALLKQATAAQRSAAESEVNKAWSEYRSKQPM